MQRVAEALGLGVVRRLGGGYFGAFQVRTASGEDAVLKVLPDWPELAADNVRRAVDLVARLRARGYPAPRFLDVGTVGTEVYTVQEYVAGAVPDTVTPAMVRELVRLRRTHEGAGGRASAGTGWPAAVLARARSAAELRSATTDPRVLGVVDRVLEIAEAADPGALRTGDVVHGDFHPGNVLVRDDRVVAVFDWEEARSGDSRADLVRMYAATATWHRPGSPTVALLRDELDATTPPEVRRVAGAAVAAHHLRYGLFARPDELDWVLREAGILLA